MTRMADKYPQKFARVFGAAIFAVLLVAVPVAGSGGVRQGLQLCLESIIPSLFPFIFVADYLQGCLMSALGGRFKLSSAALLSAVGGFVSGASAVKKLCDAGDITPKEASRLLAAYTNAGPAFVIGAVGVGMFGSPLLGYLLLSSLYLSSIAIFFISGAHKIRAKPSIGLARPPSVVSSLSSAVSVTASLCGSVLLFCCVGAYVRLLPLGERLCAALCCIIEVTGGCSAAAALRAPYLAAATLSGLSISIFMQIGSVLRGSGISLRPLLLSRIVHIPLTLIIFRLLLGAAGGVQAVFAPFESVNFFSLSPMFSLLLFLCAAAALLQKQP